MKTGILTEQLKKLFPDITLDDLQQFDDMYRDKFETTFDSLVEYLRGLSKEKAHQMINEMNSGKYMTLEMADKLRQLVDDPETKYVFINKPKVKEEEKATRMGPLGNPIHKDTLQLVIRSSDYDDTHIVVTPFNWNLYAIRPGDKYFGDDNQDPPLWLDKIDEQKRELYFIPLEGRPAKLKSNILFDTGIQIQRED